jgi:hypothetical protein
LAGETAGYKLKRVKFTFVRYDMPQECYMSEASKLADQYLNYALN